MFGLPLEDVLKLTVLAAIVSVLGNLLALYLKEIVAARSLEKWKTRQALLHAYRRFQLPLYFAADELSARCYSIVRTDRVSEELGVGFSIVHAGGVAREQNAESGPYYQRYRFASNMYRLCGFLGWIELYRRSIGTLNPEILDRSGRLDACLRRIRSVLADDWLNKADDRDEWRDCYLFREEQRAIGHRMVASAEPPGIIDFGTFFEILLRDRGGKADARWFVQTAAFFDHLKAERDFRIVRMKALVVHLTTLMELLQPGRVDKRYHAAARACAKELGLDRPGAAEEGIEVPQPALTT